MTNTSIQNKASKIKLLILDVDGVLTDGKIWLTDDGNEYKGFHVQDGVGIKRLQQAGITVAVISGRSSKTVTARMNELNIQHLYQGQKDKSAALQELMDTLQINSECIACVGDDLPDLPIMKKVGLGIAVSNAVPEVKQVADWQTKKEGGEGAVREVCDMILTSISP